MGFGVVADEEGAVGGDDFGEEALQVGALGVGGDVAELGADEVEAARRTEGEAVGDEEVGGEGGEALLGQGDERGRQIDAEGIDREVALGAPAEDAFDEVAVGAADVEEAARAIDAVGDGLAQRDPARFRAGEAGLAPRLVGGQIRGLEPLAHAREEVHQ